MVIFSESNTSSANVPFTEQQILVILIHQAETISAIYPAYKTSVLGHGAEGNTKSTFVLLQGCLLVKYP